MADTPSPVYIPASAGHHLATHAGNFRRKFKCPTCGSPPGHFCANLTTGYPVQHEHSARITGRRR